MMDDAGGILVGFEWLIIGEPTIMLQQLLVSGLKLVSFLDH